MRASLRSLWEERKKGKRTIVRGRESGESLVERRLGFEVGA